MNRSRHVLVTGGAGSIGSRLVRRLVSEGHHVSVVDDLSGGHIENIDESSLIDFYKNDINDEELLRMIFQKNIDSVFHLASCFANQMSIEYPEIDLKTSLLGTIKLLNHAKANNVRRFLFASTASVYKPSMGLLKENSTLHFETPYALNKYLAEEYIRYYSNSFGLCSTVLRYFNSYGPGEFPGIYRNVIPNFIYLALNKKALTVFGTGNESRSFCYVDDIVNGTLAAWRSDDAFNQVINIGAHNEMKIIDLASSINKLCDNEGNIEFSPLRKWDKTMKRIPDLTKAMKLLDYNPSVEFMDGLKNTTQWFRTGNIHRRIF
ncbi:MAG: NAD-dependent epimerase/dehydratase family protein [Candidatus Krumholzibacteriota bacterium]|nr:NAD-dependent epimerase/dehydratase family protein [Candidatus Krumholzibacteriota bacterium]